ncbi:SGNH hydrolase domain-containing protein [Cellulomonas persica]|uniref:SGNH domain-containing protein n=1 Tax=Cellulomonas persica TaxID=76861 RepID=A0A510URA6_9CELL|nr:SGNH hydrolase domain-containing protein [Cellulomonas persica]GEK17139.1 hypothetical protein CPE01_08720 [Cellulomonas persica]
MQDVSRRLLRGRSGKAAVIGVAVLLATVVVWLLVAARHDPAVPVSPVPTQAAQDVPQVDGRRCLTGARAATPVACELGAPDAQPSLAVVGDAAAEALLPALAVLAEENGWRLTTDLRDGCQLVDAAVTTAGGDRVDCGRPYDARLRRLTHDPGISHVLLVGSAGTTACTGAGCDEPDRAVLVRELRQTVRALQKAGKDVVAVRELGVPSQDLPACVAQRPRDLDDCGFDAPQVQGALAAAARRELVPVVDLTDRMCSEGWCPAVADGVLRYRPDGRLTASYARTLSDVLGARLAAAGVVAGPSDLLGAGVLRPDPSASDAGRVVDEVPWLTPPVASATHDAADPYVEGCHQNQADDEALSCTYGAAGSSTVIALVGDSHAAQWQPALRAVAQERGWLLRTYTKSACLFADVSVWNGAQDGAYESCTAWSRNVVDALRADPPTVLIPVSTGRYALATDDGPLRDEAAIVDGMVRTWSAVAQTGTRVLPIVDTPWLDEDMRACVRENPEHLSACAVPRDRAVAKSARAWQDAAVARVADAALVDLTDVVCPADRCAPVIGNVLVWRDAHHLTATYALSTTPFLDERLTPLVEAASAHR